jgi:hypothetical protein
LVHRANLLMLLLLLRLPHWGQSCTTAVGNLPDQLSDFSF